MYERNIKGINTGEQANIFNYPYYVKIYYMRIIIETYYFPVYKTRDIFLSVRLLYV